MIIIDVREPEEFAIRHVGGAVNFPIGQLEDKIQGLGLVKDAKIITYCNFGGRGGRAKTLLESLGYSNVINGINHENIEETILDDKN